MADLIVQDQKNAALSLSAYDKVPNLIDAVRELGKAITESGIFKCKNHAQGQVLALECFTTRQPPLTLVKRNHFMFDQLVMRADAMVSEFQARGGKVTNRIKTADKAAATFTDKNGETMDFCLTWEDAQNEPFVYDEKESVSVKAIQSGKQGTLKIKDKYATPRSRGQMLWARMVSDAIRTVDPGVNQGQYAPEELDDVNGYRQAVATITATAAVEPATTVIESVAQQPAQQPALQPAVAEVEDAEPLVSKELKDKIEAAAAMLMLRGAMAVEKWSAALAKRGVYAVEELTATAAETLYANLVKLAEQLPPTSELHTARNDGPASADVVAHCKELLQQAEQMKPGAFAKCKAWLACQGVSKIAELQHSAAVRLSQMLALENLEAFMSASLDEKESSQFATVDGASTGEALPSVSA